MKITLKLEIDLDQNKTDMPPRIFVSYVMGNTNRVDVINKLINLASYADEQKAKERKFDLLSKSGKVGNYSVKLTD